MRDMGPESGTLRVTRRAAWLLRFLPDLQTSGTHAAFSWSCCIYRLLVRFSLPSDFTAPSTWLSGHVAVSRSRGGWDHFMDSVETVKRHWGHPLNESELNESEGPGLLLTLSPLMDPHQRALVALSPHGRTKAASQDPTLPTLPHRTVRSRSHAL